MASKDAMGLVVDITGLFVSYLLTYLQMIIGMNTLYAGTLVTAVMEYVLDSVIRRVWGLHRVPNINLARRCQWWFLVSLIQSLTVIMIIFKEFIILLKRQNKLNYLHLASLFVRFLGPFLILIVSIVLLASLVRCYPITQGPLGQLEVAHFIFSPIGVIPGILCLIELKEEFVAHSVRHLAFKIATLVGATFRLIDAIVICFHKTRKSANYFRSRLQECFQ